MLFLIFISTLTAAGLFTWLKHKFIQAELRQERMEMRLKELGYDKID